MLSGYERGGVLLYTLFLSLMLAFGVIITAVDLHRHTLIIEQRWQRESAYSQINRSFHNAFRTLELALESTELTSICNSRRLPPKVAQALNEMGATIHLDCLAETVFLEVSFGVGVYEYTELWSFSYE